MIWSVIHLWMVFFILFLNCQKSSTSKDMDGVKLLGLVGLAYSNATTMSCSSAQLAKIQANRIFQTGFETNSDFENFYIERSPYQSAATHGLTTELKRGGTSSHKANIFSKGPNCTYPSNCNHRGYPTIQLHKLASGGFKTPVMVEYYSYLDMSLTGAEDWFSFATFSADASDSWRRVVLINTDAKNKAVLWHVPLHGQSVVSFQNATLNYPQKQWVKISTCLDFDPDKGFAKVWQDDVLVSTASVKGACGVLEQAHFGLYASPTLSQGAVYNDDLLIKEVSVCP